MSLLNARSICNKLPELHNVIYNENISVLMVTETWLNCNIPNGLLDPEGKFNIFRYDRALKGGGGVCIFVDKALKAVECTLTGWHPDMQVCCVDVISQSMKCRLINVYRSTDALNQSETFTKQLVQCLETIAKVHWPCYIAGDFNAPDIDWDNLCCLRDSGDKCLMDFAVTNGFSQVVTKPTRLNNKLDIVLVNEPLTVHSVDVEPPFGNSDHCRVDFTILLETKSQQEPYAPYGVYKRYLWKDADFQGMAQYLSDFDWQYFFSMHLTVESVWSAFCQVLYEAVELYVPYATTNKADTKKAVLQKVPQTYTYSIFTKAMSLAKTPTEFAESTYSK